MGSLRISFNLDDPVPARNSLLFLPPLLLPLLGTLKLMRLTMDFVRELPNPEQLTKSKWPPSQSSSTPEKPSPSSPSCPSTRLSLPELRSVWTSERREFQNCQFHALKSQMRRVNFFTLAHVNTLLITFSTDTLTFCAQITFQRARPVPPLLTQELMEENHQLRSSSPKFPTSWLT